MKGDLAALAQKTGTVDGYKKALDDFIGAYPSAPQTADFKLASAQLDTLKTLMAWRDLVAGFGPGGLTPKTAAAAQKRATDVAAFLEANKTSPLAPALTAYIDYLKAAGDALGDPSTLDKAFSELLASPLMTSMYYLQDSTLRKHFVLDPNPALKKVGVGARMSVQFEEIDPKNVTRKITTSLDDPVHLINDEKALPAPHMATANEIKTKVTNVDETDWDTLGFELIDQIAAMPADSDPVVQLTLLQTAITTMKTSNPAAVGDTYDKTLKLISGLLKELGDQPILGKTVPPAVTAQLATVLKGMPPAKAIEADYVAKRKAMFAALAMDTATTGLLLKDSKGTMGVAARTEVGDGMVAHAAGANGMSVIGKFSGGQWTLDPAAAALPEGTLVLIGK
jgi:hypothetical protein